MELQELFNQSKIIDISFFNFRNAVTGAYFADSNLKIQRVNKRFKNFFPILKNVENAYIPDVLSQLGLDNEIINTFLEQINTNGQVLIPEIKIDIDGELKVFSLLSRVTKDIDFKYLNGIQGQFIDRTNEFKLKLETENLLKKQFHDKKVIEEKSKELENLANKLSKYLSPQIYKSIFKSKTSENLKISRKNLTIFFSDIVKFTDLSDTLEPEQLSAIINSYLSEMSKIAINYGGTIDKFIGDAILVFFGDPESFGSKLDAKKCLQMSKEMKSKVNELQSQWKNLGAEKGIKVRMGITSGYCTVGNFGSDMRLDYTVLGSPVNLASRLQSIAKPNSIYVSESTYNFVKDFFDFKEVDEITPKGFVRPIKVFELIDEQFFGKNKLMNIKESARYVNINIDEVENIADVIKEIDKIKKDLVSIQSKNKENL